MNARGGFDERLGAEVKRLHAANLGRVRRAVSGGHGASITVDGKPCINFCSNDYLGLAADPRVAEAARKALAENGTGSGAAALVSGYNAEHRALEEEIAAYTKRARALLFSTGWAANLGVLRALLGKDDVLIADELNHASLIDGGRLSGARYVRVPHADKDAFAQAVQRETQEPEGQVLLVADSVFSMDGDIAPLPELSTLCGRHGVPMMIDDAHGFGVMGENGRGACAAAAVEPEVYVATLGKSLGCAGAFVAGSENLIEFMIHKARSWVFSTAPPPAIAAAARCALNITAGAEGQQRRDKLHANIRRFRAACGQAGIAVAESQTPIQPLILGEEARAMALSRYLLESGIWVAAIRPPTVPAGTARLRITFSAAHESAQIDRLVETLAAGLKTLG